MMRNYTESFMGEQCPFYRPNPYNKFGKTILSSTQSKLNTHNFTLPLESRIEDLKLNNPFKNNISISSINSSKLPYSSYKKEIEEVKTIWRKDENQLEYNVAPRKMEDSFIKSQKQTKNMQHKRISIALQELINQQQVSKEFFRDDCQVSQMTKSKKNVIGQRIDSHKMVNSSRKNTSNFKKSLARYASNNQQVVSKTHFDNEQQAPEEVIMVDYQTFYSTKVKKRKINF